MKKEPFIPILDSEFLNTKAGFKLIYNIMLSTNGFSKAMKHIFSVRETNLFTAKYIINTIEARYDKERHDYVHALFNNNINN